MPSRSDLRRRARRVSAISAIALVVVVTTFPFWSALLAHTVSNQIEIASTRFRVTHVNVAGLHKLPRETVESLAAIRAGQPLMQIHCHEIEKRIERHPWVRHVHVCRRLPSTVEIRVVEREPAAAMRGDSLLVITADSMIVTPPAGWVWDLPLLTPTHGLRLRPGNRLTDTDALALLGEALKVRAVSRSAWRNLSEVYYQNGYMIAAMSEPPVELVLGNGAQELQWAAAFSCLYGQAGASAKQVRRLDLRIPGELVVTQGTSQIGEQISG